MFWIGAVTLDPFIDVMTVYGLCKQLTLHWSYVWNMSDARKTAVCSFPGIIHISVVISRWCNKLQSQHRALGHTWEHPMTSVHILYETKNRKKEDHLDTKNNSLWNLYANLYYTSHEYIHMIPLCLSMTYCDVATFPLVSWVRCSAWLYRSWSLPSFLLFFNIYKVRKTAKIRNPYNQVPHLSQHTTWKSNKITINITNKSHEVSPFPSGDHKAAINRRESMTNTGHKEHK